MYESSRTSQSPFSEEEHYSKNFETGFGEASGIGTGFGVASSIGRPLPPREYYTPVPKPIHFMQSPFAPKSNSL